jgi:hypothetical protein
MCSGCSGGGFDEDDEGRESEPDDGTTGSGMAVCGECGRPVWRVQCTDEFDVLVSAERIVERRVVRLR